MVGVTETVTGTPGILISIAAASASTSRSIAGLNCADRDDRRALGRGCVASGARRVVQRHGNQTAAEAIIRRARLQRGRAQKVFELGAAPSLAPGVRHFVSVSASVLAELTMSGHD